MEGTIQDLDEAQLAELREDLADAFGEFLSRFLDATGSLVQDLAADLAGGDLAAAGARAHRLKGTAGYLGAVKLSHRLGQIQHAAQSGDGDAAVAMLVSLEEDLAVLAPRLAPHARDG